MLTPNKLVTFGGCYICENFGENRSTNATVRVPTDVYTNRLTDKRKPIFCERELSPVRLSSVTFVHPTQAIEIFGNVSTPFGNLAICDLSIKILRRSSQGNPSIWGVKHKRGSQI